MEQLHARLAKRMSKVMEFAVRLGALAVVDCAAPPPQLAAEMWDKLSKIVSFQPQSLCIPRFSANTEDLTLSSGFYTWQSTHPSLQYDTFMEMPSASVLLRDETYSQWLLSECAACASTLSGAPGNPVCARS